MSCWPSSRLRSTERGQIGDAVVGIVREADKRDGRLLSSISATAERDVHKGNLQGSSHAPTALPDPSPTARRDAAPNAGPHENTSCYGMSESVTARTPGRSNEIRRTGGAEQFGVWVRSGGADSPGLIARRATERRLFEFPVGSEGAVP